MTQRLSAMDSELSSLIDGLRTAANRLNADLELLEGNASERRREPNSELTAPERPQPRRKIAEVGPEPEVAADVDGARLVALNMALNGTPRDETDRYLSENFQLDDRMTLLEEVYSSVQ